jgi:hypothetical protein
MVLVALAVAGAASAGLLTRGSAKTGSPTPPACATVATPAVPLTTTATTTVYTPPVACTGPTTPTPTSIITPAPATTTESPSTVTTSSSSSTLVITGHGWGHGMGMSQWGADGYAEHGWSATQILLHYYQGTTIGNDPAPLVRVLLADSSRATLASTSSWQLVDGHGTKIALPAGKLVIPATLEISGQQLVSPLTFTPGSAPLEVGKAPYRGRLLVVSNGHRLQVVNEVGMEQYL